MNDDINDDINDAFRNYLRNRKAEPAPAPEPTAQLATDTVKEFRCLSCGEPFSREDCKIHKQGGMAKIRGCPFCKSDLVVRQLESEFMANLKYDVPVEEAILGPKPGKYAGLAAKKAFVSGKIKRKKA